ncbi:hypothetical protein SLS58_009120 [Diplodia intermedia]|uniref:Uncharacterized protein n=1 Tax=Diplodia intermedia TaxID=856260 RepID=A0ABR3TDV5_9PEZI
MPFMGDSDWSAPSTGEWSDSLYLSFPSAKSKAREVVAAKTNKPQRPAYMKHKTHASMPHLGQAQQYVFRPAARADTVDRQRHPVATKPALKRAQSLSTPAAAAMPEQPKVEKHVHFVDEGYGSASSSSSSSPATSPKQEPKSDADSRPSTADSDFEQLAAKTQQQQQQQKERPSKPARSKTDAQLAMVVKAQSRSPTGGAKEASGQHVSRQRLPRSQTAPVRQSSRRLAQAQAQDGKMAGTGGSYRNANGNICFDEFSYFGGSESCSSG